MRKHWKRRSFFPVPFLSIVFLFTQPVWTGENVHPADNTKRAEWGNPSEAVPRTNIKEKLDSLFSVLNKQYHLNGSILIAEKGEILYRGLFGYSDFDRNTRLTYDSMFSLASISKQFTAAAIMILKERGLLQYSTNIRKFLPDLPYDRITLRHLLNHTSGLIDYTDLIEKFWDMTKIVTNKDILALLIEHRPDLLFNPGDEYRYSNMGYVMLALIIEKVSGMPYEEFVKEQIFEPAGMKRTRVYRRRFNQEAIDDYAYGYVLSLKHKGYALPDNVDREKSVITYDGVLGDGAISSTLGDLLRWDRVLYTDKLVSQQTLKEAYKPGKLNDGSNIDIGFKGHSYGFGWRIQDSDEGKMVWHTGHWHGYSNLYMRYIDTERTVIGLSNNGFEYYTIMDILNNVLNGQAVTYPRRIFHEELKRLFIDKETESIHSAIKAMIDDRQKYIISEWRINDLGHELLDLNRPIDAIEVFSCSTELFPESANSLTGLAEAYLAGGNLKLAVQYFEQALKIDPEFQRAMEALKKIKRN